MGFLREQKFEDFLPSGITKVIINQSRGELLNMFLPLFKIHLKKLDFFFTYMSCNLVGMLQYFKKIAYENIK